MQRNLAKFLLIMCLCAGRKFALLMSVAIACFFPHAIATTTISPAVSISVNTFSPLGFPVFSAERKGITYGFGALVSIPGTQNIEADLYFGLLRPNGGIAYTWVGEGNSYELVRGMQPLMENVSLGNVSTINVADIAGHDPEYELTDGDSPGLYFVFALLVAANTAPSDPDNWIEIGTTPLLVK